MEMAIPAAATICMSDTTVSSKRERALVAGFQRHRLRLLAMIRGKMKDQIEAEDVVQDVFTEFVEAYDLGYAIEKLSAWLARVAQNKILDRLRRSKTQSEYRISFGAAADSDQTSPARPDEEWMLQWLRRQIVTAIEMLPPQQRDVFVKHEVEGKSFAEIAAETGVSVNTLLSRKRYAVLFLREQLKEIYDELE
jgi:RNA polymerase sigma factor (sigma-70 family)